MKTRFVSLLTLLALPAISHGAVFYSGNGDASFGGTVGNGSLTLDDDGTTLSATFTRGSDLLSNAVVLYIDSVAGGVSSTVGLTDTDDGLRRAISGLDGTNRATLSFDGGFGADYAIAFNAGFAGLWQVVEGGNHNFIVGLGLDPANDGSATSHSFSVALADLGLVPDSGATFSFLSTYIAESAFRSLESIGNDIDGTIGHSTTTSGTPQLYTIVPEPSLALLGSMGLLGLLRRRR